jgi:hypothetical protein
MEQLPAPKSSIALNLAAESIIPEIANANSNSKLVFVVRIDSEDIVARDFAAFLELIDHIYGRSLKINFDSYARRNYGHFKFKESSVGSWEMIAEQALGLAGNASPIVILWLVLKYLPEAVSSFASSYNQIEQGRLAKANRQKIRKAMEQSPELTNLPSNRRAELARLVEEVVHKEENLLPRVKRFMKSNFLGVKAYIKDIRRSDD